MPDLSVLMGGRGATEADDSQAGHPLTGGPGSREPSRKPAAGSPGSTGDQALMDGLMIVAGAWILLFFLAYTLRHHNA